MVWTRFHGRNTPVMACDGHSDPTPTPVCQAARGVLRQEHAEN